MSVINRKKFLFFFSILLSSIPFYNLLAEPLAYSVARDEGQKSLEVVIKAYKTHREAENFANQRSDIWSGAANITGVLAKNLPKKQQIGADAISVLFKGASWDAERIAKGQNTAAKSVIYTYLDEKWTEDRNIMQAMSPSELVEDFKENFAPNSLLYQNLLKTTVDASPLLTAIAIEKTQLLINASTEQVNKNLSDLREEIITTSREVDENLNLLNQDHRDKFGKILIILNDTARQRRTILESTRKLSKLQTEMAVRLENGQSKILDLGNKTFTEVLSTASSARLLVSHNFLQFSPQKRLEELNNLKSPWRKQLESGMKPKDFNQLLASTKSQKLRADISKTALRVQTGIVGLVSLAKSLNLSIVTKPKFQEAARIANGVAGAVASYYSGNPMGVISSIGSMFGGGQQGPSAGEMKILAKLAEMDAKLDDLLKGQKEILKSIKVTTRRLLKANNKVLADTGKILEGMDLLIEQSQAMLLTVEGFSDFRIRYDRCATLQSKVNEWVNSEEYDSSYQNFIVEFNNFSEKYGQCSEAMRQVWPISFSSEQLFPHPFQSILHSHKRDVSGKLNNSLSFVRENYRPLINTLWRSSGLPSDGKNWTENENMAATRMIVALATPANDLNGLRSRSFNFDHAAKSVIQNVGFWMNHKKLRDIFTTLLEPTRLANTVGYLIQISQVKPLINQSSPEGQPTLLSAADLTGKSVTYREEMHAQFSGALLLLNIAIAQQSLLSGDLIIPNIADIVFSTESSPRKDMLIRVLKNNPILYRNLIIFHFNKELSQERKLPYRHIGSGVNRDASVNVVKKKQLYLDNLEHYNRLISEPGLGTKSSECIQNNPDTHGFGCILVSGNAIADYKLTLKLQKGDEVVLPIPSAKELAENKYRVQPAIDMLRNLRSDLLTCIDLFNTNQLKNEQSAIKKWVINRSDFVF